MATRQTEMKSELQSAGTILKTDFRYKVPPHQRNFSWTLEEVKQLWDDVVETIQEDRPEYFLGTIVVQEERENKTRIIIDGQQRLATITMLLSGIRTVYKEQGDEWADEVNKDYLGVRDRRSRLTESRVTLNVINEPAFQKLVVEDQPDAELHSFTRDVGLAQKPFQKGQPRPPPAASEFINTYSSIYRPYSSWRHSQDGPDLPSSRPLGTRSR